MLNGLGVASTEAPGPKGGTASSGSVLESDLTMIAVNQKSFEQPEILGLEAIKSKYYEMFRGKGGEGIDEEIGDSGDGV